jgi:hypothetical protein
LMCPHHRCSTRSMVHHTHIDGARACLRVCAQPGDETARKAKKNHAHPFLMTPTRFPGKRHVKPPSRRVSLDLSPINWVSPPVLAAAEPCGDPGRGTLCGHAPRRHALELEQDGENAARGASHVARTTTSVLNCVHARRPYRAPQRVPVRADLALRCIVRFPCPGLARAREYRCSGISYPSVNSTPPNPIPIFVSFFFTLMRRHRSGYVYVRETSKAFTFFLKLTKQGQYSTVRELYVPEHTVPLRFLAPSHISKRKHSHH